MTADASTESDITGTVTGIVAETLGRDAADLTPGTDLRSVEGADSIKVLRIVAKLEQTYDIELEDDEIFGLRTIGEVVALVGRARERG
ncbi:acyl carrier protein [Amycolatopsis tucumanensis]|uniref:Carrier domain-containing protein n=1 Tax=Amycolatopsis tucumanensis TaxID=401106 RepID=A0ABP7HD65_9PSEU|nr:acyl carrier protein [Amycolatopsis tucumanensis]MCF6421390.1 acyl carrier protein [Amycolatopsis tucumanensis]